MVAGERFADLPEHDVLGRYRSVWAGRIADDASIPQSSSGGMTSWIVGQLLEEKLVDGVVHVGSGTDELFEYQVSSTVDEAMSKRKSVYYSTSMDEAIRSVEGDGKRYAFVGVPCFITALRHLQRERPGLEQQFPFLVGLVCGHLKSTAFARLLAWQLGIAPDDIESVDFRVKRPGHDAADYAFGARATGGEMKTALNRELVGANWGHAMMQLSACDFCDDIFAETADVVLGDAWLEEYREDWRGTNVVVSRHPRIDEILNNGRESGQVVLESLAVDRAAASQGGNVRHRRLGLSVRIADNLAAGLWTPRKRVHAGQYEVSPRRAQLIRQRRRMSALSHELFDSARRANDLGRFLRPMKREVTRYQVLELGPVLGTVVSLVPSVARSRLLRGKVFRVVKRVIDRARRGGGSPPRS
jgi:coenzyme F420-reducing hydrogenase beta subunit